MEPQPSLPRIAALPPLREELSLLPGPPLADGQPTHTLHDPVRNLFFQVDWPTFEILRRWGLGSAEAIAGSLREETTLDFDAQDVEAVIQFLHRNALLQPEPGSAGAMARRLATARGGRLAWLLHHYLFFRIPLVRPDAWLGRWLPRVELFFSRGFLLATLAALALGLLEVWRDWERFSGSLVDTFTWSGMAGYAIALGGVKVVHELGHAFTAKRLGCRVPTMGVAFLVLWPVAYTDTNEAWRLTSRRQRLQVAGAGILTELAIAAWATLAWSLLPPGVARTAAFLLATTTWVSTVAINASPFMRFDGYFLLSDWLEMPNLHARAFALARWDLRERLFALGEPVPEVLPARRHAGLVLFAWATWAYRLVLFLGIAALVYAFFIKAVGIALFAVEMVWFVAMPFWTEARAWWERRERLAASPRARRSAWIAGLVLAVTVLPWPGRPSGAALLRPADQLVLYAPAHAQVRALPVARGQAVAAGAPLLEMDSPDLALREQAARARLERLRWQATAGTFDAEQRALWPVLQGQLAEAEAEWAAIEADRGRYLPAAPFAGVLADLDPELAPGTWVRRGEVLGRLVGTSGRHLAVMYLEEDAVARVRVGDGALFALDGAQGPLVRMVVRGIDADASRVLPEPGLASLHGGSITVRERQGSLYPEQAVYRVVLEVAQVPPELAGRQWRGTVTIRGGWEPPAARVLRHGLALLRREAGF